MRNNPQLVSLERGHQPARSALIALALLGACATAKPAATRAGDQPQMTAKQVAPPASSTAAIASPAASGAADLDAALRALAGVSLFFDFDRATLTTPAEEKLTQVAEVLVKHPNLSVQLQGNTDARGTEAYNIALGQRRADAARDYLLRLGVQAGQLSTVSYGEEKPKVQGHSEEAYQQNRRDDVVAR